MKSRTMATCAMVSALCVVLMILGGILELGMYAAPMFAGLVMILVGKRFGMKYQVMVWITVSLLSVLLVPHAEQNLLFACFFGWYPIARPKLEKLPRMIRLICKLMLFNAVIIAVEMLVMKILAPEVMDGSFLALLLLLANVTFVLYDRVIPRMETILERWMGRK